MRGRLLIGALFLVLVVGLLASVRADSPPHVAIGMPAGGSTVSGTVTIAGHAWDDVHVVLVQVHIDQGEWWNATDNSGNDSWWKWSTPWDTTKWADGWHRIGALAKDSAGQLGDAAIEVYVHNNQGGENHPPWAHIESPPGGSTVRGMVAVNGTSGDPDANDTVEMVQVRIDLGEWNNATATGDNGSFAHWTYAWNTSLVADGWHAVRARAYDGTVWGEPAVKEYYVDNVQGEPWVEIVEPKTGQTVYGTVLVHGVAGADGNATVELVQVRIGDGDWHDAVDTSHNGSWGTWAWQWDTTQTANGQVSVCARSWDGSLYSSENCRQVKVANENHRPGVKILHPYNGQTVSGLFLIHGTAWDDGGVELVQVEFNDGPWHNATDTSPDASWATWAYEWNTKDRDDGCLHVSARGLWSACRELFTGDPGLSASANSGERRRRTPRDAVDSAPGRPERECSRPILRGWRSDGAGLAELQQVAALVPK